MKRIYLLVLVQAAVTISLLPAAHAQKVQKNMIEHSQYYHAPREYQIIDDSPVVRDFREAPEQAGTIDLPPGPQASGGPNGGSGAGALAGGPGSSIPGSGVHLPGNGSNPGYRSAPASLSSLPKIGGFGGQGSNIPARGIGAKGPLPGGFTTGIHGELMHPAKASGASAGAPKGLMANNNHTNGHYAGPAVQTYSGGYGSGSGSGYGGSANRTEALVRGSLLRSK